MTFSPSHDLIPSSAALDLRPPQTAAVIEGPICVQIQLPSADSEVMPGLCWGPVEGFPSPAYWTYQVLARRVLGTTIVHKLGRDLVEEVAACLLGGHGIPAEVGIEAFVRIREAGVLRRPTTEQELLGLLSIPLSVRGRPVRYRFAAQKARYLAQALDILSSETAPLGSGRELRDWLTRIPGVGLKTASWVARNLLDADDVAILDIHILRAGDLGGFLDRRLKVERDYLELERQFLTFCSHLQIRPSELDSIIWSEMKASPLSVRRLLEDRQAATQPHQQK